MRLRVRVVAAAGFLALLGHLFGGPVRGAALFGLVDTGAVFVSADQGVTWTVRSTLPVHDAVGLAAGESAARLFLATASGTVYRSDDAGTSWNAVGAMAANDVCGLLVRPDLAILLLTASGAVYRSTDQGASLSVLGCAPGSNFVSLSQSGAADRLYALARSGEIWESVDGGAVWTVKGGVAASDAVGLRWVSSVPYLLTASGDMYKSSDGGSSWSVAGTLSQVGMTSLTADQGALIAAAGSGEVATSFDGASWTWRGATNQMTVRGLGTDEPASSGVPLPYGGTGLAVSAPWPNPVRCGQAISMDLWLAREARVSVELVDIQGRGVVRRMPEFLAEGGHRLDWRPPTLATGVYVVRVRSGGGLPPADRKLVVLP